MFEWKFNEGFMGSRWILAEQQLEFAFLHAFASSFTEPFVCIISFVKSELRYYC